METETEHPDGLASRVLPRPLYRALAQLQPRGVGLQTPAEVFEAVSSLRRDLERGFEQLAKKQPVPPIGALVRALRR